MSAPSAVGKDPFTPPSLGQGAALQVAPLLSHPAPDGPLEEILSLSNKTIFRRGVPLPCIKAWRDRFYEGVDAEEASLVKFSRETAWAYDERFFVTRDNQMEMGFDEKGKLFFKQTTHQDYFVTAFHHMMHSRFWDDSDRHIEVLSSLYRLHKTVTFPDNDPTEQVFFKLMDCLVEKIVAHDPKLRDKEIFSLCLPNSKGHGVAELKHLCCHKTVNGWRVGDFNAFPDTSLRIAQFNTNNTKMLVLDKAGQLIQRPCVFIEARVRHEATDELLHIVKVNIVLCRGSNELSRGQRNAITFTFEMDLRETPLQMHRFRQDAPWITDMSESVKPADLEHMKREAEQMFVAFQTRLTGPILQDRSSHVALELLAPRSPSDKLWVIVNLLTELKKDPVANAEQIAHVAEIMHCAFSEEELAQLSSEGKAELTHDGCTVSSEAVVDKLLASSKAQLMKALQPPKAPSGDSASSAVPTTKQQTPSDSAAVEPLHEAKGGDPATFSAEEKREEERQRFMQQRTLEKQVEKERRREAYEFERRKAEARAARTSAEETTPSCLAMFSLDFEEQQRVDSVYGGQPMKAKDFATFAMGLLRRKAQCVGASVHQNTVGSHPKLHFKRADGTSGGVTFRIHHGGDDHGYLTAQRDTLGRIFDL